MNQLPLLLASAARLAFSLLIVGVGSAPSAAFAQSGRIEQGQITSAALAPNLFGDPTNRPFKVYLPPSYGTASRRYPVIYVLHGYGGDESSLVSAMQPILDSMIAQGTIGEMIAVFVNGSNVLNGSFYLSSPVIGDYETYITSDLVNLIDSRYPTLNSRAGRGVVGFSMGGWGAMHLALKFPPVFSVVVAESGLYDSRSAWADGLTRSLVQISPTNLMQYASVPFPLNAFQALFEGLLPDPQRPSLYADYPYALVGNQLVLSDAAHQRCLTGDVQHGDLARYVAQPVRLNGIKVVHGTNDTVVPISEARQFTNALASAGLSFTYEEHTGDHVFRADLALPFLASHLVGAEGLAIAVQPRSVGVRGSTNPLDYGSTTNHSATFTVTAYSDTASPITYQWRFNGVSIPGATLPSLTVSNVTFVQEGSYDVVLTDAIGSLTSAAATLTVLLPPTIFQPDPAAPLHLTAVPGENVTLSTEIRGNKPIFVRWFKFGAVGAGILADHFVNANSDFLVLNNISNNSVGTYALTMTNIAGRSAAVVNTNAILTVLADSNGNGLPDDWESAYFGSPTGADRNADSDGDGMSNWAEYVAGTNPTNAASYLNVDVIAATSGALLTFQAASNRTYTVQYTDGLGAPAWLRLADVVARNSNWVATVTNSIPVTNRYYRLVTPRQ